MHSVDKNTSIYKRQIRQSLIPSPTFDQIRLGLIVLMSLGVGLAVIVATYYVENVKLLIGLIAGVAYVLLTMQWPEFGILCLVALLSGLISLSWLPTLGLGPISINISDMMLLLLLGLVFLRATSLPAFSILGSSLMLPLMLFMGAFILSGVNAILINHMGPNTVLRSARVLMLWIMFIPTLQLVRNEQALRRLLFGLLLLTGVLLFGVLIRNRLSPLLYIEEVAISSAGGKYSDFTRFYYAGDMVLYAMIPVTVASLAMIKSGNQLWRICLLGLLIYWAYKTYFREYWLTLFVGCTLLFFLLSSLERLRLLKRMVPAIVAGILVVVVLMTVQPARVERITHLLIDRIGSLGRNPLKESSLQWRVIETRYALQQIRHHPLLGIGLGNTYRPQLTSEVDTTAFSNWTSKYIENGYLFILLMMGLVGLLPFLWLCAAYLFRVFQNQHEIQDDGLRAIYLGFGVAFLGMLACNVLSPTFVIGTRLVYFPVSMAISEIILRLEHEKKCVNKHT